jgi:NADH/F420H2 dehydrogenase subunit C
MNKKLKLVKLASYLQKVLQNASRVVVHSDVLVVHVNKQNLFQTCLFLKNHSELRLDYLLDIWGVDYPDKTERFEVSYLLCSLLCGVRIILKVVTNEIDGLNSVVGVYKGAGWLEREVWDMFGVLFYGNPDLRRILTDYGFEGYPLRKDFPLSGYIEVRYDDGEKRVLQESLEVSQAYRSFNFKSPWEN